MKNLYFTLLIFSSLSLSAQKVEYDNASKWFLGFNLGGTWQSTDVANKTGAGWGIILGKSYNYNYGKALSFDIRARYLRGFWYGQDSDTSSLAGYSGSALSAYNSQGLTVHNFQSDVHRLGLELAIHMNALTQRTGWDPYVFGGIGFTWHQTFADLINQNDTTGNSAYDYSSMLANSTSLSGQLENTLDEVYDSPLDGYNSGSYNVAFMPSLGFGLGYHIGKRVTLGVEHKTTFTLKDKFDAVQSASPRSKNDRYHYTSLYINFRLRDRSNSQSSTTNTNVVTNPNSFSSCPPPSITINSQMNLTVTNPQFDIDFRVNEVFSQNEIQVLNGNNTPLFFNFNSSNKQGRASVTLVPGLNTFTINARNRCGTDSKTFTITYNNCSLPVGSFTNPNPSGTIVRSQAYVLGAIVNGVQNKSAIKIFVNEALLTNYYYNSLNGVVEANINLNLGINKFRIELSNICGNATIESNVTYDNCVAPTASFLNPSASGTTVNTQNLVVRANVSNISSNQQVNVDVNGVATRNFTLVNGVLTANVSLVSGINTITIRLNNACGSDTEVTTINYQTCNAPIISVSSPVQNSKVSNPNISLQAKIEHIQGKSNLKLQLNGVEVTNYNFGAGNNGVKTAGASLTLINGLNTITISATNNCGTDVETIQVEYDNCVAPAINITSISNETTNNSYALTASITNMADANGITVSRNGQDIGFNFSNGQLFSAVTLLPGLNTFIVSATKSCGTATKTISVNYKDCEVPTVSLNQPTSGITVNSAQYSFSANATNINTLNQVIVTLNNQIVNATLSTGVISGNLNLSEGTNILSVKVTNACGFDVKTVTINRVSCTPPNISISNPTQNAIVTSAAVSFEGTLQNTNAHTITLNGTVIPASRNGNLVRVILRLKPGNNVIVFSGTNDCGNDTETVNVVYDNCVAPVITLNSSSTNQTVNTSAYNVSASITNTNQNAIAFTLNGIQKPFVYSNGLLSASLLLNEGSNLIVLSTSNACGSDTKTITVNYEAPSEEKIIICHYPPGNTGNPQQLEIPLSAWPAHQAHGDAIGPCPVNNNGNSGNGGSNGNNGNSGNNGTGNTEEKIIICHYPPGNTGNPQQLEIPLSAWPAHQAHGDAIGPCPTNNNGNSGNGGSNGNNGNSGNNGTGNTEEKIIICHYPPGNTGNPQQLEIPLSAWPAHQAHGDAIGPCPTNYNGNPGNGGSNGNNGNSGNGNSNGTNNPNNGNSEGGNNSGANSNNGHGNNVDGVDSSNPGQGTGGPNGTTDQSGNVDDELNGNGTENNGSNGSGSSTNSNNGSNNTDNSGNGGLNGNNNGAGNNGSNSNSNINGGAVSNQNEDGNGNPGNNNNQNGGQKTQKNGSAPKDNPRINNNITPKGGNSGNSKNQPANNNDKNNAGQKTNKSSSTPQGTNNPSQNNNNKTNSSGGSKEEKPKEDPSKDNKPKVGPKVNTQNKGGGK